MKAPWQISIYYFILKRQTVHRSEEVIHTEAITNVKLSVSRWKRGSRTAVWNIRSSWGNWVKTPSIAALKGPVRVSKITCSVNTQFGSAECALAEPPVWISTKQDTELSSFITTSNALLDGPTFLNAKYQKLSLTSAKYPLSRVLCC